MRECKGKDGEKCVIYNRGDFIKFWWKTRHDEYSAPVVKKLVGDFLDVLRDFLVSLDDGDSLRLIGLGTFTVEFRDESDCKINGKTYHVPAHNILRFSLDKGLKKAVVDNSDYEDAEDVDTDEF